MGQPVPQHRKVAPQAVVDAFACEVTKLAELRQQLQSRKERRVMEKDMPDEDDGAGLFGGVV